MNCNDEYIVKLCKASIFDKAPENPESNLDWDYIYNKSVEQNIAGLLFTAVSKLDTEFQPDKELMAKWNAAMLSTIGVMSGRYNEFLRMNRLMQNNGITFIGLKGCVIRNLYPVPELRTMGDFDILTNKNMLPKIVKIFKDNGYSVEKDIYGVVAKSNKAYWEVFYSLEQEFAFEPYENTQRVMNNLKFDEVITYPTESYFLAHMIIHTGKHYIEKGAGIRNLCDIALFIEKNRENIDFKLTEALCKKQNYYNIYCYILSALKNRFDISMNDIDFQYKQTERFIEYTLSSGVFGRIDNVIIHQAAKSQDDSISGMRKILFPSIKTLDYRYTYLKKFPFLLPIAWIHRFFSAIFRQHFSIFKMLKDIKGADKFSRERLELLNELGINNKH